MNNYLKDCGKNIVKSAIDCSQLIGKQDILGATSCLISLKETTDSCIKTFKETPRTESPRRSFQFQKRDMSFYNRYRDRRNNDDILEFNERAKIKKISIVCQECNNNQIVPIKSGEGTLITCPLCGCESNFSIKI